GASVTDPARLQNYKFNSNPDAYRDSFPKVAGTAVPSNIVLADPDFKFPQVWRTNLALDKRLGNNWTVTLEALYSNDLNSVSMRNANQRNPDSVFTGVDDRPRYRNSASRRYYSNVTSAVVLENTDLGNAFQFTAQLTKNFSRGFYGSLAYTYSFAQEVTANPGNQASSVWNSNPTVGTQNDLELSYSNYAVPHRIVGNVSYRLEWLQRFATTISLFYEGAAQGNYSYVYNGDLNNDGNNTTDLLYIPKDASEIIFVNQSANAQSGLNAYTAEQQREAFFRFVENTPYLRDHKGQYAERNAAFLPWYNRLDLRVLQDISGTFAGRKHSLQVSLDVTNFANLISSNWGIRNQTIINNPLVPAGVNAAGQPTFRMTQVGGQLPTQPFQRTLGTASTWGMQLGLRYIF
ncbi:MAG TPA: hypothetical protein VHK69_12030, partial [Chitinophagaceae bacterium]|nr:hypothetical protein [Chitinophagaceae bacterium]